MIAYTIKKSVRTIASVEWISKLERFNITKRRVNLLLGKSDLISNMNCTIRMRYDMEMGTHHNIG